MDSPPIQARGLTKRFKNLTAVDGLSFDVRRGEIFGLVGPDGAGKTTTLRMLSGILNPAEGNASVAGFDVQTESSRVKDHLAYMSQRFGLYADLTVEENIEFYADLYGVPRRGRAARIGELLDFSYMRPFRKRQAGKLSGGMKQKLQLVCALVHTPKVLLLDEPTNGVDPVSRRDFWRILYELLGRDVSILVTTSYLDEAERCQRVGLLNHGKLLALGTPDEVKRTMRGGIVAVRGPMAWQAAKLLRTQLGDNSVNTFGDTVHVVSDNPAACEAETRRLLEAGNIAFDDIHQQAPSIEDVFVSVLQEPGTGGENTPAAAQQAGYHRAPGSDAGDVPAVTVKDLSRHFGSFVAVNAVSFEVPRGEIFGFLGPNGAGKSTTIRMLCGLLEPSSGTGTVAGFDIHREAERIKEHIGYMSQKFSLYEDLTVEENIEFYGGIYGLDGRQLEARKDWAVAMAGLEEHRHSVTSILSSGWKQRLAMACAILHEPPIVFLDEPTSGVDPLSRRRFWNLIYEMAERGVTIFVTTHYMEEAEYCDRVALIYRGNMIALGAPAQLKRDMMPGEIIEVQCAEPQRALACISALEEVHEAALFGTGLHVFVPGAARAVTAMREACHAQGIALERVERVEPGMEDLFVALIEQADREGVNGNGAAHV